MKLILSILLSLALFTEQAYSRQCFPAKTPVQPTDPKQVEILIASDDHPLFQDASRKCSHYWPYYEGNIKKTDGTLLTQAECLDNANLIDLSQGYAPLGVFFRMTSSRPTAEIQSYEWKITGPGKSKTILAKYDSFNAAHVFEKAGTYRATLKVTYNDGAVAQDEKTVNVWARKGSIYYVDAVKGDDRYNGKSKVAESKKKCDPESGPIGTCKGPWRTATRAFGELSPRDWASSPSSKYTASSVCSATAIKQITEYPNGNFAQYKSQPVSLGDALKDETGTPKTHDIEVCTSLNAKVTPTIQAGDQILFKRGQTFDLEAGTFNTNTYTTGEGQFEQLGCDSLISPTHFATPLGILFSAYGSGKKPKIVSTGAGGCITFNLNGVGVFHISFQDLDFNLENSSLPVEKRSLFMFSYGNMMNLVLNRVDLQKFFQGVLFLDSHGVFLNKNNFFDSSVIQLFSETSLDVALLNNKFDYSGNHISYTNMSNGLIVGNRFSRPAFGRTALRIFGDNPNVFRAGSVWISDNYFSGWIDPRTSAECTTNSSCPFSDGKRYNFSLIEFHSNSSNEDKFSENITFTRNFVKDGETMIKVDGVANLLIDNNILDSADGYDRTTNRILLNTDVNTRPLDNIKISNNLFIERNPYTNAIPGVEINIDKYEGPACDEYSNHNGINIFNNSTYQTTAACFVKDSVVSTSQSSCLVDDNTDAVETSEMAINTNTITPIPSTGSLNKLISTKTKKWTGPKK